MSYYNIDTLVECFIAAHQVRPLGSAALSCKSAKGFHRVISLVTGVDFDD